MKTIIITLLFASIAISDWHYSEEIDPITDDVTRIISTQSTSDTPSYYNRSSYLYIRITGDLSTGYKTELWVSWPTAIGESNLPLCITRVDNEDVVNYEVAPSTATPNNCTFFYFQNYLFVKLLRGNQFVVRFTPTESNTMTSIFSLDGMNAAAINAGMPVDFIAAKIDSVTYSIEHRFIKSGDNITDSITNLEWCIGTDVDTNWDEANDWVKSLAGSWRMPTLFELEGLYNAGIKCGDWGYFQNTGVAIWSNQTEGTWVAFRFYFDCGLEDERDRRTCLNDRAFAVRPI